MIKDELDTIAAIATPIGEGALSIIRISGTNAIDTAAKLFRGKKDLRIAATHTAHFGSVYDLRGTRMDEVVCVVFLSPNSYTGEDVVEFSCHGGMLVTRRMLGTILDTGVRQASPGEFTKRAFLNGKMDLAQAEAVADLIQAKSESARRGSLQQLQGELSDEIRQIRNQIVDSVGLLELELDFAEDGYEFLEKSRVSAFIKSATNRIDQLLNSFKEGRIRREGAKVVLIGAPNVGKSSLLNALLQENRAIVTDIPGTTRDVIEESISVDGVQFRIVDTAGLRETPDAIEKEGMRRTLSQIESADAVLFLIDSSRKTTDAEVVEFQRLRANLEKTATKILLVANKADLNSEENGMPGFSAEVVRVSAKEKTGIGELKNKMMAVLSETHDSIEGSVIITSLRHAEALVKTRSSLISAEDSLQSNRTSEFVALDLRAALSSLGEIVGEVTTDEILESVFSKFCIGK